MNKKYCLIYKKCGIIKRGTTTTCLRMKNYFPEIIDVVEESNIGNIDELNDYERLIFTYQNDSGYSNCFDIKKLLKRKHLIYTRKKDLSFLSTAQNGFYCYKNNNSIKYYIPFITDFKCNKKEFKEPVIGIYVRNSLNYDILNLFKEEVENLNFKINLITMGNNNNNFKNIKNIKSHIHTFDNNYFFENITHYYFPKSAVFIDPFPNTLLEAIQCNKQIISTEIKGRNFKDGIDEILELTNYHNKPLKNVLNSDIIYENKNFVLNFNNFKKFYNNIIDNDFLYKFDKNKFNTFYEWLEANL